MLLLGTKSITIDGIQVFPDHADPNQFWYLPGPVSLARDPQTREARLLLLEYRPAAVAAGAHGGGFLMFTVNLEPDPHLEERLLARVAALSPGEPKLSAVEFDDGTVQCVALNVQGGSGTPAPAGTFQAVETIFGSSVPSLYGDNAAAFDLTLSEGGVTILHDALQHGTTPVGVIYNLKFTGMRPALDVKITTNYKRIFDQFSASLSGRYYFLQATIEAGFEKLRQDGVIKIEVTNFTGQPDYDQKAQWALDFFRDKLIADWFEPTLLPGQFAGGGADTLQGLDTAVRGNSIRPPAPVAPQPPSRPPAPPASGGPPKLPGMASAPTAGTGQSQAAPGTPPAPPARPGTPPAPPARPGATPPTAGSGSPPKSTAPPPVAAAGLKYNPTSPQNAQVPLGNVSNTAPAAVALKLKYIHQDEDKEVTLEYHMSEAVQRTYAPQGFIGLLASDLDMTSDRHFRPIDLDNPFFRQFTVAVQAPIDYTRLGLTSATVALDYGDPVGDPTHLKHTDFEFDPTTKTEQSWAVHMDDRLDTSYSCGVEYHFNPGSDWHAQRSDYRLATSVTEDRTPYLNPYNDFVFQEVSVFPNRIDADVVASTDVLLSYTGPSGWQQQTTLTVLPGSGRQYWRLRLEDPSPTQNPDARRERLSPEYQYHFEHHLVNNTLIRTEPVTTTATSILVDDPFAGALDLTLVPVYDPSQIAEAFADIHYEDPPNRYVRDLRETFTGTALAPVSRHISLRDPTKNSFTVRLTFVGKNGSLMQLAPETRSDTLVPIMPKPAG
jgi:hypothetical protein